MKLLLSATLALLTLTTGVFAQVQDIAKKMQEFSEQNVISGAVTLVVDKDKVLHQAAVGKSDLESGRAMTEDTLFWIASMTKPMAAFCVGILVEEGKLAWNDPVEKHLPEFKGQWLLVEKDAKRRVLEAAPRPITIHDLATHTSGLGNLEAPRAHSRLAELTMGYAREPLTFAPGAKWSYSNPGINVLGRLVEVASGMEFSDFLQQRVLDPLGMKDTTFWPNEEQAKRLAKSYKPGKDGKLEATTVYFFKGELSDRKRTPYPAGGLYSTAGDIGRFYQMLLNEGSLNGKTLMQPATLAELVKTQSGELRTGFTDGMSWGYGFQVVREPQGVTAMLNPGTFGHGGAYATNSWADPKAGRAYILMIQRVGFPNADASDVRKVFQELASK